MADLLVLSDAGGNLSSIEFPAGMIMMYSGSSAPRGWAVCDGSGATPDLRGRFIMGAGNKFQVRDFGGADEGKIKLTTDHLPSHSHGINWLHPLKGYAGGGGPVNSLDNNPNMSNDDKAQPFGISTQSTGGGAAISIYPPYYVLMYVMKL